ncbi:hypothetical protein DLEV_155 [Diachasmimorpha longicaudata entomopoxvirus]|uniref:Ubiquitin-like protease family profile domain-containing protein n=1 Tax=Diachasmimorpha longicaudata entomopoxvirus TaxID=109981 RepID=A0A7R5WNZ2_9POXV|nr:hypothetical protein QKK69_gp155 [Diachasmimorpha longicaudata entomopoxvirus]AKS26446.1 hypothetical protein DLEV_155 [Diachasmimorpha longicaudata entomopoxvirus]
MLSLSNILQITNKYNPTLRWFHTIEEGGDIFLVTNLNELHNIISSSKSIFLTFLYYKHSHWTILCIDRTLKPTQALYVDSLGYRISEHLIQILALHDITDIFSSILRQQKDSINCGLYAALNLLSMFDVFNMYNCVNKDILAKKLISIKKINISDLREQLTNEGILKNLN